MVSGRSVVSGGHCRAAPGEKAPKMGLARHLYIDPQPAAYSQQVPVLIPSRYQYVFKRRASHGIHRHDWQLRRPDARNHHKPPATLVVLASSSTTTTLHNYSTYRAAAYEHGRLPSCIM